MYSRRRDVGRKESYKKIGIRTNHRLTQPQQYNNAEVSEGQIAAAGSAPLSRDHAVMPYTSTTQG